MRDDDISEEQRALLMTLLSVMEAGAFVLLASPTEDGMALESIICQRAGEGDEGPVIEEDVFMVGAFECLGPWLTDLGVERLKVRIREWEMDRAEQAKKKPNLRIVH